MLDGAAFTRNLRVRVEDCGAGWARISIPPSADNERPGGILSGHIYVCAADVALWLAIKTTAGIDDASVTTDLATTFLAPLRRATLCCEARVTRLGARLVFGTATCTDADGKVLSQHLITYARR